MFPCKEVIVAMWDPVAGVVKANTSSTSQHLNVDPLLQRKAQWPKSEGEGGGTGSPRLSPL